MNLYIIHNYLFITVYIYNHLRLKRKLKGNINELKEISKKEQVVYFIFVYKILKIYFLLIDIYLRITSKFIK